MPRGRNAVTARRLGTVSSNIGIQGIEEIKAEIEKRLDRSSGEKVKKVFMRAAMIMVREAKSLVPVKTGRLRDAIFAAYGDPKKPNVLVGVNYRRAPHAHLIEYGHGGPHKAGAHPYMRPALAATRSVMAASLAEGMRDLITK